MPKFVLYFVTLSTPQAGLRAVHDLGPEIRRAISGCLNEDEILMEEFEMPAHRVIQLVAAVAWTRERSIVIGWLQHCFVCNNLIGG